LNTLMGDNFTFGEGEKVKVSTKATLFLPA